jgi:serine/threonine-protein kinase
VFYYAMEMLDGLDAEQLVTDFGPLPAERVVHVLLQICHSLSEAHGRGLVHRDIKPANIVLCRYGEDVDFVKVLDFGLVTALRGAGPDPELTAAHSVQGTPSFIAPEQALGLEVDERADLYATGCVTYWLLTGRRVFTGDTAAALLVQHASASPVPPSERTELPIPAALEDLVLACLAKDPGERPPSAHALAERLESIEVPTPWTRERAREWWGLHFPETPRAPGD